MIAPCGLRPHYAMRPFPLMRFAAHAALLPGVGPLLTRVGYFVMTRIMGFPKSTTLDEVIDTQLRASATQWAEARAGCDALAARGTPTLVACTHRM